MYFCLWITFSAVSFYIGNSKCEEVPIVCIENFAIMDVHMEYFQTMI